MNFSHTQRARVSLLLAGITAVSLALSSCSADDSPVQAAGNSPAVTDTVAIAPIISGTAVPTTASVVVTTAPPTTEAPTTTAAPTTTVAETSTTVPVETTTTAPVETTTTLPPETTTTLPPLAPNEELVGPSAVPVPAVGKRSGPDTQVVQARLLQLGFWLSATDGEYGLTTRQAVMAFQKYIGLPASGEVDQDTATWMTALALKAHGQTDAGTLVEVDKGRQLLFFVVDGKTQWVFNTSTATGLPYEEEDKNTPGEVQIGVSITPDGLFKTDRERPEGWWEGDLGQIYRPKYFRGGVAVHGSNSIPNYPASHGCVRVSVAAMDWIWETNMMPLGTTVWVHE